MPYTGPIRIDPKEIRRFVTLLNKFNSELASKRKILNAQYKKLGETWQDPQYKKFESEFSSTMARLEQFERSANEIIPELINLAKRVDDVYK